MLKTLIPGIAPALLAVLSVPVAASSSPPFHWLTGQWWMNEKGQWAEEIWSPIRGDRQMLGVAHTGKGIGKTDIFEFMRIAWDGSRYVYHASPRGAAAVAFRQAGGSADCPRLPCRIVFENPANDYPKRIEYRIDKPGALRATISGADPARDRMSWTFRKIR